MLLTKVDPAVPAPVNEVIRKWPWSDFSWTAVGAEILHLAIILIIGIFIIRIIRRTIAWICKRHASGRSMTHFIDTAVRILLNFLLIIILAHEMGFETASLVAILGSIGIAIGLGLQGTLSDLASGILIIIIRPIRYGDFVFLGTSNELLEVKEICFFNTVFINPRGFTYIVPNKKIIQNDIINLSKQDWVKLKVEFSIAYDADIQAVRNLLLNVLKNEPRLKPDETAAVSVTELADSGINMAALAFVRPADYLATTAALREAIKQALDKEGIEIPYPQMELRMYEKKK
ncbi:MAG: mechanosensitive ion channel [Eubacteriales bacterium]|nr:mechanosensitive ion channel [Eubacteriales bacterium]